MAIILFDGVCNLCNGAVQFILKRDVQKYFKFASLQSEAGQRLAARHGVDPNGLHSMILIEGDNVYQRSTAVLRIARHLKGFSFTSIFLSVPTFLRDGVYNFVARRRYRLFGKADECMLPTRELRSRFLE